MPETKLPIETVLEIRDSCLCLAAQRAARLLARRFDRVFAPLGLTNGQFSLLVALSADWSPRLGTLAELLAMDHATVTAAMRTLSRHGLVTLETDPADARARIPRLTEAGRARVARAVPLWRAEHARINAALEPEARAALPDLLGQLARAAGSAPDS
ncbi:MarR family winged helix-turn-helix transcriptional regulator [Frigidibacter sp. ROC022]|uniref:MarR family winged helix-turn-helix transcriptional regulator n=1 Tax=Frigidibacter sp. ROC022 TaxID=2971796 RepID=UPI00215A2835|nr:MarR family winged helix-turn-helix transcriptional regulator [Frigidibacter sp. ROC022]MCR8723456.1 MarR family winged helix-turn-helix transcriptional regulator [Frigidibacter sp. ROC022]